MSGYSSRSYNKYNYRPRYRKPRNYYQNKEIKKIEEMKQEDEGNTNTEAVQANLPNTREQGIQIDMGEGIPCRLIPINPDDYPRLLALLNLPNNS